MNSVTHSVLQTAEVRVHADHVILTLSAPHLRDGAAEITVARRYVLVRAPGPEAADLKVLLPVDVDSSKFSTSLNNGVLEVRASRLPPPSDPSAPG